MSGSVSDTVFVTGVWSDVVHLRDDCPGTSGSERTREVAASMYPDRRLCRHCDPDVTVDSTPKDVRGGSRECLTCGALLDDDGECSFGCDALDLEGADGR